MRSLQCTFDSTGGLCLGFAGQDPGIEVLAIPEEYTDAEAFGIIDTVYKAGILEAPAGLQVWVRITWAALTEKGMAAGVLAVQD